MHAGCGQKGHQDGKREKVKFNSPSGVAVNEENGDVYVADSDNRIIRKITLQGHFLFFYSFHIIQNFLFSL